MNTLKVRNSNHELMRIISMFFIVLGHVLLFGKLLDKTNGSINYIYYLFEFILIVHVNSYVLVSGYYQSKSSFKISKVWDVIKCNWFYRILFTIIFLAAGLITVSKVDILIDILPVSFSNYWFINCYLMLYCLSPFINSLIKNLTKNNYQKLLVVGFLLICVIPTISNGKILFNNGYSLYSFVYLYLVGGYLRIYPLEDSYFFRIFSKKAFQIIMITIFVLCVLLNNILFYYGKQIDSINSFFSLVSYYIKCTSLNYSNPIVVIQSIAYFSFFTTLTIKSKIINYISNLMLGVYFIHENNYMRLYIYKWLKIASGPINKNSYILYVFMCTLIIFTK